ncbi:hypothetical protein O181_102655 [Austropuccinia psidii MF-1]|uniref:Uncharacterized protein n=1 Tax=Austropuccinia psidii MF-1 TaxID=1389203 RepID=A0A9Q3PIY9_9BASI|nr:hypothetical protein [Austropuccinia psidii MF-1]
MDANTTNTSDMGPQNQFNSTESSDMECSSSESIIAISTAIPNAPPELPEGAFCPSANESDNGYPISTTNDHLVEIPETGGVTNHHENIVPSPNLDTQEATTVPNENISTATQRTVAEDEIVLTQTNSDPPMDSAACSLTLTPSHSCMKINLITF